MRSIDKMALASAIFGGVALVAAVGSVGSVLLSQSEYTAASVWIEWVLVLSFLLGFGGMVSGAAVLDMKGIGRSERLLARIGSVSGMLMLLVCLFGVILGTH
jgi:hypothetical protein